MTRVRDKRVRRRSAAVAAVLAIACSLALSATAMAGQDELKGGSVVLQLQNGRGVKLSPKHLTLPINGGAVDPVDGSGTVQVSGGFKARRGKGKAKVKITTLNLGSNRGRGSGIPEGGKEVGSKFPSLPRGQGVRPGGGPPD